MPFLPLRDVSLFYEWSGQPTGAVLVFSNSLGTDLHFWEAQVASPLAERFRLLRYDTRGHGRSSTSSGPCTLETLGEDLLALLNMFHVEHAYVCGISLGGMTALWLAIHKPERVRGIIAANTAARIGTPAGWADRIAQVQQHGTASLTEVTLSRWFTPAFVEHHPALAQSIVGTLGTTSVQGYMACCAAIRDADLTADIAFIRMPALIVAGTHDSVTPLSDAQFLARQIPDATYVELPAAHLSNVEAAYAFTQAILAFLDAQQAGG